MNKVKPIRYSLRLEPDLETFACPGRVAISVEAGEPMGWVTLHAAELQIRRCRAGARGALAEVGFELDEERQHLTLRLPEPVEGEFELEIDFQAEINDAMAGFYRSRYVHGGETRYLAVTQFEERDARRAFPCFDEPGLKAVFDVEMVIADGYTAIANTPIRSEESFDSGRKLVVFEPTPRMSTYLLFFGVGDFEYVSDESGRVPIRAAAAPGRARYAAKGIEFARDALEFCEAFTGIEYPLGKLDLIAVPDFAYGAMENFGAITYRENYVLYYPDKTSRADLKSMAEIGAHEVAHMWFGDLVSPADWSYIWLNEAFATYFGKLVIDAKHPDWDVMKDFIAETIQVAMSRDSLAATVPIELPSGEEVEVDPSTAPIIYSKAGSILHMVRAYLGDEPFQNAVQSFLSAFAFDCAETEGFIETFSKSAGSKIAQVLLSWIRQEGFPIIGAERTGDSLSLSQKRFTLLGHQPEGLWSVPVTMLFLFETGDVRRETVLLESESTVVDLPRGIRAVKVNAEQAGFYRVAYDRDSLRGLGEAARDGVLGDVDRFGLLADLSPLVTRGDVDAHELLDFIEAYYSRETEALPLREMAGTLRSFMCDLPSVRERAAQVALRLLDAPMRRLGYLPKDGESFSDGQLRSELVITLFEAGSTDVGDWFEARFDEIRGGGQVPSDIYAPALRIGAARNAEAERWFREQIDSEETNELEKRHLLSALGWVQDEPAVKRILRYVLESVPVKNRLHVLGSLGANPVSRPMLWDWYRQNSDELAAMHPYHFASTLAVVIAGAEVSREGELRRAMESYMEAHAKAPKGTIEMSLERLAVRARLMDRYGDKK